MNKYYVYFHRRKDNNQIFYVGKGTGDRYKRPKRSVGWLNTVQTSGGFIPEIVVGNLTESEALCKESELILQHKDAVVNKVVSFNKANLDKDVLNSLFYYDETSPTCLRWKTWNKSKIKSTAKFEGDIAGYALKEHSGKEYFTVRANGKQSLVHRIVWTMFNGEIPEGCVINHKDSDGCNNTISNLTCITIAQNNRQTTKQKASSGVNTMTVGEHTYSVCSWTDLDGNRNTKLFSHKKLGEEESVRLATEYRRARIAELNALGAGYIILQN